MLLREQRSLQVAEILGEIWEQNYVRNKLEIRKSLQDGPAVNGDPMLVIGAGPSLEKNLDHIDPTLYNISACDKVCPLLAKMGITPDLIFALNSEPTNVEKWIEPFNDSLAELVVPCGVHPDTYSKWNGEIRFINAVTSTGLHHRVSHETGLMPVSIGSNVGTFAYTMCGHWGANPIAYIGLDFSFLTRDEIMLRYDAEEYDPKAYNVLEMTDINGDIRFLDLGWFDMAEAFQERVRAMQDWYGTTTVNCTEGGINYSDSVMVMTLKEFNDAIPTWNFQKRGMMKHGI
ncbi:MAG: DUF115 domain-containing protein [Candidatus Portnoybacteria bacterium]|nr:DUF115 domain-containing protein [Candidatus Portnoybacteria bacterium]